MVKCLICSREFKQLQSHLKGSHSLTTIEYKQLYPNAEIMDKDQIEIIRKRMNEGQALKMSGLNKGCSKPKLSILMKGNKRGLGTNRSFERERYREQALKQHAFGNFGSWDQERRTRQSDITSKRWLSGDLKHVWKPKWHLETESYFKELGIEYQAEYILPLDRLNNGYRLSKPFDFYLPKYNLLIELQGCFWHGCMRCYKHHMIQDRVVQNDAIKQKIAFEAGYRFLEIWEHDKKSMFKIMNDEICQ